MRKLLIISLIMLSLFIYSCNGEKNIDVSNMSINEIAVTFIDLLSKGEFKEARRYFDTTMKFAMPKASLKIMWNKIQSIYGEYKGIVNTKKEQVKDKGKTYNIVFVNCETKAKEANNKINYFILRVVFDKKKRVAGLWYQDGESPEEANTGNNKYESLDYVNLNIFTEEDFVIQGEACPLPGTLTLPKDDSMTYPAVVLVHGSGPNDRDETIGPNKPFKDLAYGLASKGVAVLRYEKRTKHCVEWVKDNVYTLTVEDETINDAVSAVSQLKEHNKINPDKIFIAGHSLGANVAPRIAMKVSDDLAGIIMLAGNVRPLSELIVIQTEYIINADGEPTEEEKDYLAQIKQQVKKIETLSIEDKEVVLGGAKAYWEDFAEYKPVETATKIDLPMLILQGERDYQVTMEDFNLWRGGLSGKQSVMFKSYPKLNHLFMEGEGKSTPDEYNTANHISKKVIDDISEWLIDVSKIN